jgi:hypothetical protein
MEDSPQTPSSHPTDAPQVSRRNHTDTERDEKGRFKSGPRTTCADTIRKRRQSPRNLGVFRGIDLRTVAGRRMRSLYPQYLKQAKLDDADLTHQAAALKVAKLTVLVERLQDQALKSRTHSRRLGSELVRHENMLRRAKLELFGLNYRKLTKWQKRAIEYQEEENDDRN